MNARIIGGVEFLCPFCGGHCHAGQVTREGSVEDESAVMHKLPVCKTYDDLEALEFMRAVNEKLRESKDAGRRALLLALRCSACERAPYEDEVREMMDDFGHSLRPEHAGQIVWCCKGCGKKKGKA